MPLTISQIINMNVGFLGIQYSFGLQQNSITPLYTFLKCGSRSAAHTQSGRTHDRFDPYNPLLVHSAIAHGHSNGEGGSFFWPRASTCSDCFIVYAIQHVLVDGGLPCFGFWMPETIQPWEPYRLLLQINCQKEQYPLGFQTQSFYRSGYYTCRCFSYHFRYHWLG